jgi:hypothetical protein
MSRIEGKVRAYARTRLPREPDQAEIYWGKGAADDESVIVEFTYGLFRDVPDVQNRLRAKADIASIFREEGVGCEVHTLFESRQKAHSLEEAKAAGATIPWN